MEEKVKGGRLNAEDEEEIEKLKIKTKKPLQYALSEQRGMYPDYLIRAMKRMDALSSEE